MKLLANCQPSGQKDSYTPAPPEAVLFTYSEPVGWLARKHTFFIIILKKRSFYCYLPARSAAAAAVFLKKKKKFT